VVSAHVLDTTGQPIEQSVAGIEGWITDRRSAHAAGLRPLRRGWDIALIDVELFLRR
jgi:hypothetical protein